MGIFENLGKWQNYLHYVLLTAMLILVMHVMGNHFFHQVWYRPIILLVAIFVIDTIIHALFYIVPEPVRWQD